MISDQIKITLLNLKKVANSKIHWYVNDFLEDRKGKGASWIHIYEGERGKQILVIDVDSSSYSDSVYLGMMRSLSACLQEKKSSDQTSWRNIVFVRSQEEEFETKREGERMARRSGPISLSLFLCLLNPSGSTLGTGPGKQPRRITAFPRYLEMLR